MFAGLGYEGVSGAAGTWLSNTLPILALLGGVALTLTIGGIFLKVTSGARDNAAQSGSKPAGMDKRLR